MKDKLKAFKEMGTTIIFHQIVHEDTMPTTQAAINIPLEQGIQFDISKY